MLAMTISKIVVSNVYAVKNKNKNIEKERKNKLYKNIEKESKITVFIVKYNFLKIWTNFS